MLLCHAVCPIKSVDATRKASHKADNHNVLKWREWHSSAYFGDVWAVRVRVRVRSSVCVCQLLSWDTLVVAVAVRKCISSISRATFSTVVSEIALPSFAAIRETKNVWRSIHQSTSCDRQCRYISLAPSICIYLAAQIDTNLAWQGSGVLKAGFAGDESPKVAFNSMYVFFFSVTSATIPLSKQI